MNTTDKRTVENLRNERNGKRHNRSRTTGQSGAAQINVQIDDAAEKLARAVKNQIGAKALQILQQDLQNGDLGDFFAQGFEECLESMTGTLEAEYYAIQAAEEDPKLLPFAD